MHFKIITTGWDCASWIEKTLSSVERQTYGDYQIHVVSDPCDDPLQEQIIREWCDARDDRWMWTYNTERKLAMRNQVEGIAAMDPGDEDVIVWLDLDGDQLAHPKVLEHLVDYYSDGETLLTYGSYRPHPLVNTCTLAHAFPDDVIREGSYRKYTANHACAFNHLRTMKHKVYRKIPHKYFKDKRMQWLETSCDYATMMSALELAGGRHKFIEEILLIYNHDQPHPDYKTHNKDIPHVGRHILSLPPLRRLEFS